MYKRILSAVCALTLCLCASGCSDNDSSSKSIETSEAETSSVPERNSYDPDLVGERLKKVAEIYDKGSYTLECTLTSTEFDGAVKIMRVVNGTERYQLQTERLGSHGSVTIGSKSYDFDYVCGMYREAESEPELNVIKQIILEGVPRTYNLNNTDVEEYDVEQYTFTGDTYITVMDFFFDKQDGHLVKYTTEYTDESRADSILETRVIDRLDNEVDESVFNAYFSDELVDLGSMSEEQRLGFCQGLCGSWGITTEELFDMGISAATFRTIDYDTLFRLIHTYGKPHEQQTPLPAADDSSFESSSDVSSESSQAAHFEGSTSSSGESTAASDDTSADDASAAESTASDDERL